MNNRIRRQSGSAVIEMAFVFPILFMLSYGTIVYSFAFYLQQSLNFLAEESARSALAAANPNSGDLQGQISTAVTTQFAAYQASYAVNGGAGAVLQKAKPTVAFSGGAPAVLTVSAILNTADFVGKGGGFAQVVLPGIGAFPPLPATLTGTANATIN